MLKKITILCVTALLLAGNMLLAQNTNSPYTRFGYGELSDYTSGRSKSMGGASIGMRSNMGINTTNPASYTGIDSMTFMYEVGGVAKQSRFTNQETSIQNFTANVEYLTMLFPIGKRLAASFGFLPFSFVGYDFTSTDSIVMPGNNGEDEKLGYYSNYTGTGSISHVYLGLAGSINKHLSVGVNVSYLFGSLQNERSLTLSDANSTVTYQESDLKVKDLCIRYGLQYYTPINKTDNLGLGLILETKSKLGGDYTVYSTGVDTISKNNGSDFETPFTIGLGATYEIKNKLTFAADLLYQNWSSASFFGVTDSLKDRFKVSLGAEYRPNLLSKNYFQRMVYRTGVNLTTGYWNVNGNSPSNVGITFGLGLPTKGSKTMINLGFEYGRMGTVSSTELKEDYFKFTINAAFNENWFFKRRFD
jgi:hypothetical protein